MGSPPQLRSAAARSPWLSEPEEGFAKMSFRDKLKRFRTSLALAIVADVVVRLVEEGARLAIAAISSALTAV